MCTVYISFPKQQWFYANLQFQLVSKNTSCWILPASHFHSNSLAVSYICLEKLLHEIQKLMPAHCHCNLYCVPENRKILSKAWKRCLINKNIFINSREQFTICFCFRFLNRFRTLILTLYFSSSYTMCMHVSDIY